MGDKIRVSTIMTSYNGEKYIKEQIESILAAMTEFDELIISDDGSSDNSISIINEMCNLDSRIVFYNGPRKGLNSNINFLLSKCRGDYIFISDQDDVWEKDKIEVILNEFKKNPKIQVIHHNSSLIDSNGDIYDTKTVYQTMSFSVRPFKFFIKSHCFGSMMAFKRDFLIYDFVPKKNCYDGGLMFFATRKKVVLFIDDILMKYRRHENNVSTFKRRRINMIIVDRWNLMWFFLFNVLFLKKCKERS